MDAYIQTPPERTLKTQARHLVFSLLIYSTVRTEGGAPSVSSPPLLLPRDAVPLRLTMATPAPPPPSAGFCPTHRLTTPCTGLPSHRRLAAPRWSLFKLPPPLPLHGLWSCRLHRSQCRPRLATPPLLLAPTSARAGSDWGKSGVTVPGGRRAGASASAPSLVVVAAWWRTRIQEGWGGCFRFVFFLFFRSGRWGERGGKTITIGIF